MASDSGVVTRKCDGLLTKFCAFACGGIASAQMNAQFVFQTHPGDWSPQIFLDVVGEGAERRNVDTAHARFQSIRFKFAEKRIKNTKKPGQRFPASGWRG